MEVLSQEPPKPYLGSELSLDQCFALSNPVLTCPVTQPRVRSVPQTRAVLQTLEHHHINLVLSIFISQRAKFTSPSFLVPD